MARYLYGDGVAANVREELVRQRREQREAEAAARGDAGTPREPGSDDDLAPEPRRAPRQHQPQQQPAGRPYSGNGNDSPPRSGKALFAWIRKQEDAHGVKLLPVINGWGKDRGLGHKMVEWPDADVAAAHAEAVEFLQHNGHMAGAGR